MAINYTTLYTVLGKYVKTLNTITGFYTQIVTGKPILKISKLSIK